ncbi:F-box protein At1g61340-like [Curcuma longa]|uniref:F-box protein At1g61340-like n=1 Tax=Curcuma longa TaxID=136217 RepID=UPI003D9E9772
MALGNVHRQESVSTILKFVHSTNTLRRKRVALSNSVNFPNFASPVKLCGRSRLGKTNRLENLPQDVLVRILCKVEHRDLKQLLLVSKTVNAATSVAKDLHFAFATPISKPVFRYEIDDREETPNAPKQQRIAKSRLHGSKLSSIATALFTSSEDE